ncbi:hypothetical protein AB0J83_41440 [Actinoplanes sp. NPDC049596]|uniref:hypothetical protein n=1 Tax=unclassified Actinoplanes TaxID=2626549 RepID=UPI00341FE27C
MIEVDEKVQEVIEGGQFQYLLRVDSYYNNRLLRSNIPVRTGFEEVDLFRNVPERAEFRIPRIDAEGFDWSPTYSTHPLAANGQTVRVSLGIGMDENEPYWFRRCTLRIDNTVTEDDEVVVQAVGLLETIRKATFTGPFQPSGTIYSTIRDLLGGEIPVYFDPDISNGPWSSTIVFDSDRLKSLISVIESSWPGDWEMTPSGVLYVREWQGPITRRPSVFTLVEGDTIIRSTGSTDSDSDYNCVVVRYETADGDPGQAIAYNNDSRHPKRFGGPNSKLPVPYFETYDWAMDSGTANHIAAAILDRIMTRSADAYEVEMIPNPLLWIGDVGTIRLADGTTEKVQIVQSTLPYTFDGGRQRLLLKVASGGD